MLMMVTLVAMVVTPSWLESAYVRVPAELESGGRHLKLGAGSST